MTIQRKAVWNALKAAGKTHPNAEMIYQLAKKELPHISMGTVYRNLSAMSARG